MKAGRILTLLLVAFATVTFAGCTSFVRVDYLFPPNQQIPRNIKNITIKTPKDYRDQQGSGERVRNELSHQLRKAPGKPYVMVERDEIRQLLDEKDFSQSGFAEATKSSEQLFAGVDAFITGAITSMSANVQETMKQRAVLEHYWGFVSGRRMWLTRTKYVPTPFFMLRGEFGISFKMVDVGRGIVVAELAPTIPISLDQWETSPSAENAMRAAVKTAVHKFVAEIAPTVRSVNHVVESAGGAAGFKALQDRMYEDAADLFRAKVAHEPNNPSAHYGLAIALGALGEFDEAIQEAGAAYRFRQDSQYSQLKNHLQMLLNAWEEHDKRK